MVNKKDDARHIYIRNGYFGTIGEPVPKHLHTCFWNLKVGDLVSFKYYGQTNYAIVVRDGDNYGFYGWGCNNMKLAKLKRVYKGTKLSNSQVLKYIPQSDGYKHIGVGGKINE